jgi:hypothetical protein
VILDMKLAVTACFADPDWLSRHGTQEVGRSARPVERAIQRAGSDVSAAVMTRTSGFEGGGISRLRGC